MGNGFGQFDRAIHRMDLTLIGPHPAGSTTVRAVDLCGMLGGHFPHTAALDHLAQPLTDLVGRHLDLIVMRRTWSLLKSLKLGGSLRRLFQQNCEFLVQRLMLRFHAKSP
jgi:hypothetical protein